MKLIRQMGILFLLCLLGQVIHDILPFDFPAGIIGLVLLFVLLAAKGMRVAHIQETSDFLLSNMAFFFIPASVSVMNYFDVLSRQGFQILIICLITTVLTFAATALSVRAVTKWMAGRGERDDGGA
jgi:holin-like protein